MSITTKILGSLLLIYSISMWYGHRMYVRKRVGFQYATAYQMILATYTALGLLLGCHIWILAISIPLWFLMQFLVINFKDRKYLDPSYILNYVIIVFALDLSFARGFEWWGWILSIILSVASYMFLLEKAFPIEQKEWK